MRIIIVHSGGFLPSGWHLALTYNSREGYGDAAYIALWWLFGIAPEVGDMCFALDELRISLF